MMLAGILLLDRWIDPLVFDSRLRVVSNFGDSDFGAREIWRRRDTKGPPEITFASRRLQISCARACVFRLPYNRHRQN